MVETHGLEIGDRVIEADGESTVAGTLKSIDPETGNCMIEWDNGHTSFETSVDEICPVDGW